MLYTAAIVLAAYEQRKRKIKWNLYKSPAPFAISALIVLVFNDRQHFTFTAAVLLSWSRHRTPKIKQIQHRKFHTSFLSSFCLTLTTSCAATHTPSDASSTKVVSTDNAPTTANTPQKTQEAKKDVDDEDRALFSFATSAATEIVFYDIETTVPSGGMGIPHAHNERAHMLTHSKLLHKYHLTTALPLHRLLTHTHTRMST